MKKIIALLLAAAMGLTACAAPAAVSSPAPTAAPTAEPTAEPTPEPEKLFTVLGLNAKEISADDSMDFTKLQALYEKIRTFSLETAAQMKDEKYIYSPMSAFLALASLSEGASGATYDELAKLLMPDGFTKDEFGYYCRIMLNLLTARKDGGFIVDVNTIAAVDNKYEINESFAQSIKDYYLGESVSMKLASQEAVQELNKWTSDKTNGLIDELFSEPFSEDAVMVLINTVYFLGKWSQPFDEKDNYEGDFHGAKDSKQTFMKLTAELPYAENKEFQVVRLEYDGGMYMDIYLPAEGKTPKDVMTWLQKNGNPELGNGKGTLALPKFELESSLGLNDILKTLGASSMFKGGLKGVLKESANDVAVSTVFQKAKITVDEKGTEAAAATAIIMETTGVPAEPVPFEMTVDRPFFYNIGWNGVTLFMGEMTF